MTPSDIFFTVLAFIGGFYAWDWFKKYLDRHTKDDL